MAKAGRKALDRMERRVETTSVVRPTREKAYRKGHGLRRHEDGYALTRHREVVMVGSLEEIDAHLDLLKPPSRIPGWMLDR